MTAKTKQCPRCSGECYIDKHTMCDVCEGTGVVYPGNSLRGLQEQVTHLDAQNTALKTMLHSLGSQMGLIDDVRRYTDALSILAGRIPEPPLEPGAMPTWMFGSAGAAMEAACTKNFAQGVLEGELPAPRTRKWLTDSIVEAVRAIIVDRDALRQVLRNIVHGVIGRHADTSSQPHKIEWWHMCGFIHGPSLESVLRQMVKGTDEESKPRAAQMLASVKEALKEIP